MSARPGHGEELALPARPALVVVDMQNDFCHRDGYYEKRGAPTRALTEMVAPSARLLAAARGSELPVLFTRLVYEPQGEGMEAGKSIRPAAFGNVGVRLARGSWGAEVVDELAPRAGETVVDKSGYSAFYGTELERELREREVDGLVLCGVTSYGCLLHTAFDAFVRGFGVIVVDDATAGWFDELTEGALGITDLLLGRTASVEQTVALIEGRNE